MALTLDFQSHVSKNRRDRQFIMFQGRSEEGGEEDIVQRGERLRKIGGENKKEDGGMRRSVRLVPHAEKTFREKGER